MTPHLGRVANIHGPIVTAEFLATTISPITIPSGKRYSEHGLDSSRSVPAVATVDWLNRCLRSLTFSILSFDLRSAKRAALEAMDEFFPERPAFFFDFVLPPRSKQLFANLWIADPHVATPSLDRFEGTAEILQPR